MNFVFDRFLEFAKLNPVLTTTNILMSITFPVDDILIPYLSGKIVTFAQGKKPFKKYLIALILVMTLMQVFYVSIYYHDAMMLPKLQNYIRETMFTEIIKYYQVNPSVGDLRTGEMMSRMVKIPLVTIEYFERMKNYLIPYMLSFSVTSAYIAYKDLTIGVVMFISGLLVAFLIASSPSMCARGAHDQEEKLAKLDEETEDILRNLPTVYTTNMARKEIDTMVKLGTKYQESYMDTTICTMKVKLMASIVLSIMLVTFGYSSYHRIKSGKLSVGLFVTIFMVITQWYTSLGWLSGNIRDIVMEWGILTAHSQMLKQNNMAAVKAMAQQTRLPRRPIPTSGLYVDRVSYMVDGRSAPILDRVSLHVRPNERVAIVGRVGSGKSTLLKIIARLATPSSGSVYINGRALSQIPMDETKRIVGYVQQHPTLFNRSIYDNISYGTEDRVTKDIVDALVERLGLKDVFDNLDNGLNTLVGKNGSSLSGGQRQLVQMMRMMLMDPEIVVMDEVTASLDNDTKKRLFGIFDIALKGKTVIMVTHDDHLMKQATRIVDIKDMLPNAT